MLRKLIWLAITSGLAKKLYTQLRTQQQASKARKAGGLGAAATPPRSAAGWRAQDGTGRPR